jgi:MFS transporter, MHS family, shikimate and dehydroshikimate transport protein
MSTPGSSEQAVNKGEIRRVVLSGYVGSAIEYYDFLLYVAAASLIFGQLFFSRLTPTMATIASLGTLAIGYVSRPIGAAFFGHFGDRYGRKSVLVATLVLMGVSTSAIGLLPTGNDTGLWSPTLLIILRLLQGLSAGGEWGGGVLMAFEHAPGNRRGLAGSFINAGGPSGTMLAALVLGLFALLPQRQFMSWGWRIPFLLSFLLVILGLWMRLRVTESPIFLEDQRKRKATEKVLTVPLLQLLRAPKPLIFTFLSLLAQFVVYSLIASFGLTYAKSKGLPISSVLAIQGGASVFCAIGQIASGYLSDFVGRKTMMILGMLVGVLFCYPFLLLLSSGDVAKTAIGFIVMNFLVIGPTFGPCAAFLSEQFETGARYTGASLGYQGASTIGAGFSPLILSSLLAADNGGYQFILVFVVCVCAISVLAILLCGKVKTARRLLDSLPGVQGSD